MRRLDKTFDIALPCLSFLAAGSAPISWRRGLSYGASQIGGLSRACHWISLFANLSATLRDEPLFGRCIAELVSPSLANSNDDNVHRQAQSSRSVVPPHSGRTQSPLDKKGISRRRSQSEIGDVVWRSYSDTSRLEQEVRQTRSPQQRDSAITSRHRRRVFDQPSDSRKLTSPQSMHTSLKLSKSEIKQFPQYASRELLESCANGHGRTFRHHGEPYDTSYRSKTTLSPRSLPDGRTESVHDNKKASHNNDGVTVKSVESRHFETRPRTKRDNKTYLRWQQPIDSSKARAIFAPPGEAKAAGETFAQRLIQRTVSVIRDLQSSANGELRSGEWLNQQWSMPLNGTAISNEWLSEIVSGQIIYAGTEHDHLKQSSSTTNQHYPEARKSSERREVLPLHFRGDREQPADMQRDKKLSSLSSEMEIDHDPSTEAIFDSPSTRRANKLTFDNYFNDSFSTEREGSNEAALLPNHEQIKPPAIATSLPALSPLPEAQTDITGVLPLASETARRGALEEAQPLEDLDALAAKIKFILDEQARRHGIDV